MPEHLTNTDFNQAVSSPSDAFADIELARSTPVSTCFGVASGIAGGYTVVYRMRLHDGRECAVRCFTRNVPHLEERYARIASFLRRHADRHFVGVSLNPAGIVVQGRSLPTLRMEWVKGQTLTSALVAHRDDPATVGRVLKSFLEAVETMQRLGMAHGDLHADNIMWDGSTVRLIDYDGMFVPGMSGRLGSLGWHPNYQHPARDVAGFGPDMDRFSILAIALSLLAIRHRPDLHRKFATTDENIIFTRDDFLRPDESPAFAALAAIPCLTGVVRRFAALCQGDPGAVPTLHEFRSMLESDRVRQEGPHGERTGGVTLLTRDRGFLAPLRGEHFRSSVTLVGRIDMVRKVGDECVEVRLGDNDGTTAVIKLKGTAAEKAKRESLSHRHLILRSVVSEIGREARGFGRARVMVRFNITDANAIFFVDEDVAMESIRRCTHGRAAAPNGAASDGKPRPPPSAEATSRRSPPGWSAVALRSALRLPTLAVGLVLSCTSRAFERRWRNRVPA